ILGEACSKLRESRDQLVDTTNDMEEELSKIFTNVFDEISNILHVDDLYKQIQESIQPKSDAIFNLTTIDKFVRIENVFESLKKLNK
ncbi:hypothetical protein KI387_033950, partial [Taxus chinensis]